MATVVQKSRTFLYICVLALVPTANILASGGAGTGVSGNELKNPLQVGSIEAFLVAIIQILVVFATPIIVLFIMYAGYLFVTAQGDTGKLEDAKRALLWSVVGGVIVLGAELIARVIEGTVTGLQL